MESLYCDKDGLENSVFRGAQTNVLFLEPVQLFVEDLAVIRELIRIEVQMQVHPPLFMDRIAYVGAFLFIVPGNGPAEDVQLQIAVIVLVSRLRDGSDHILPWSEKV